jgi:hypothetical protein
MNQARSNEMRPFPPSRAVLSAAIQRDADLGQGGRIDKIVEPAFQLLEIGGGGDAGLHLARHFFEALAKQS